MPKRNTWAMKQKHTKTLLLGVIYKGLYYPIMLGSKNHIKINHYYRTLIKQSVYWKVRPFFFFSLLRCFLDISTLSPTLGAKYLWPLNESPYFCRPNRLLPSMITAMCRGTSKSLSGLVSLTCLVSLPKPWLWNNWWNMLLFKETSETWCEWKFR